MSKNSPPDNFKRLDQAEIKATIGDWAKDYPSIEKISLYRMKRDKDFPNDPKYVFVVDEPNLPTKSDGETEKSDTELEPSLIKYYKETHENCSHIYHLMEDFYRIDKLPENKFPDNYQEEWLWFTMNKEDGRIEDYEMVMDVEPLVLYERDDQPCSAASTVVASPATPSSAEERTSENANDSPYKQIKGEEIINLLSIAPFELIEYMEYGLPAYAPSGKEIYIRSDLNRGPSQKVRDKASRRHTVHKMSKARGQGGIGSDISPDPPGLHGIDLPLPDNEEKANKIIKQILDLYFLIDDYEEFAKKHALKSLLNRSDAERKKDSVRSKGEPDIKKKLLPNQEDRQELHKALLKRGDGHYTENGVDHDLQNNQAKNNSFKRNGDIWEIQYKGDSTSLRNLERIHYIVHLLENPNKQFLAHYLASLVKKNEPASTEKYNKLSSEQLQIEGLSRSEHSAEGLSEEEYERLKNQAHTLWDRTFISPDNEKANQDWQELKNYMQNQHGVFVNDRGEDLKFIIKSRLNKDNERARSNVKKRIVAAIKDIKTHLPSLADHLSRTIKTGRICIYETESNNSMNWDISW